MIGRLDDALSAYQHALDSAIENNHLGYQAIAYDNIGTVYQTQGELDQALGMYEKSLEISLALAIANNQGLESLEIHQLLGRKEGIIANQYGNVYQIRGELVQAIAMYEKSLEIHQALESKEGYRIQGKLDQAKE